MKNYISTREIDGPVKRKLIETLNFFIRCLRSQYFIHYMMTGSHSEKSYHYKGEAADGHIGKSDKNRRPNIPDENILIENLMRMVNKKEKSLFEQAIIAWLCGFGGVGMYPYWNPRSGLHTDLRKEDLAWIGLNKKKLKKAIKKAKGKQVYIYLN